MIHIDSEDAHINTWPAEISSRVCVYMCVQCAVCCVIITAGQCLSESH